MGKFKTHGITPLELLIMGLTLSYLLPKSVQVLLRTRAEVRDYMRAQEDTEASRETILKLAEWKVYRSTELFKRSGK
jgi:hypothetical protein